MAQSIEVRCPSCLREIPFQDIGLLADVAICQSCGHSYRLSELAAKPLAGGPELNAPPPGMSFARLSDGFRIEGTTRSWTALYLIPFPLFLAVFLLSGVDENPSRSGHFVPFPSVFGMAVLIASVCLLGYGIMAIAGKVVVTQRSGLLTIFTGVGFVGWTRTYDWADFSSVTEKPIQFLSRNRDQSALILEGKRRVAFGTLWNGKRRYFALHALRTMLSEKSGLDRE